MKKPHRPLSLHRHTVRVLGEARIASVAGGFAPLPPSLVQLSCLHGCPQITGPCPVTTAGRTQ